MRIEQAVYGNPGDGGFRWLARSPGFTDDWLPAAQAVCTGFGDRPAGVRCPRAVFALPLGRRHVAVVRAADQGHDGTGRPGAIAFRLLVLPVADYDALGGDPFQLDDAFEPDWAARGELPPLEWAGGPPRMRTVADLERVLNVENDRCAWLLGGAQVLVDGGRLAVERPSPDEDLVRDLWALLPYAERARLWPTTFAFGNAHRFHVAVVPHAVPGEEYADYIREGQAGEYPDGRYELALQTAVEAGDQPALERLLTRRSRGQMVWVAVGLLALVALVALASRLPPVGGPAAPGVPALGKVLPFDAEQEEQATQRIVALLRDLGAGGQTPKELDRAMAARREPVRDIDVTKAGPLSRQLRALMWKYGAKGADEPGLTLDQVFDRLREAAKEAR